LFKASIGSKVAFQYSVQDFSLAVGLRVKSSVKTSPYYRISTHFGLEFRRDSSVSIRHYSFRRSIF
jgi:hypothetical protein